MAVVAYPKDLTDPFWKKVEKKAGVSGTGVGQTLRASEKAYAVFAAGLQAMSEEATTAAKVKPAKAAAVKALHQSSATLTPYIAKVKDAEKKKLLKIYGEYIDHIATEINNFDLEDRRGFDVPLHRFNDRIPIWGPWFHKLTGF